MVVVLEGWLVVFKGLLVMVVVVLEGLLVVSLSVDEARNKKSCGRKGPQVREKFISLHEYVTMPKITWPIRDHPNWSITHVY